MAQIGKFKVRCLQCGKKFIVDNVMVPVPKHPPKSVKVRPYEPYVPCEGSGLLGDPIGPVL